MIYRLFAFRRSVVALLALLLPLLLVMGHSGAARASTHKVYKGQSLWKIAKRYNVTVDEIRQANNLVKGNPIKPGQVLDIPDGKGGSKKAERESAKESNSNQKSKSEPKKEKRSKDDWVTEKPPQITQTQRTPAQRGGVNPCLTKDGDSGIYDSWSKAGMPMGQALLPGRGGISKSGYFDVVFHFHGHDPARKEWVKVMDGPVFVGLTLGIGSGVYSQTFQNPAAFERMITAVEKMVAEKTGNKNAKVRKIGLSAWSAGYGAIEQILTQAKWKNRVDAVILLDGLHSIDEPQLAPFVNFAKQAKAGKKLMFVSHSSIIPPGYASTWESTSRLINAVGGKPRKTKPRKSDPMGLELVRRYSSGNFHVRGYMGNDKMDHCAHVGLFGDVLKVHIKPRWNSVKGYKSKK